MPETRPAAAGIDADRARQLDEATRADMESFRDYDAATFRAGHDPRAVTVFADGQVTVGIDATMDRLAGHFTGQEAIWRWTELGRVVEEQTAFVYYEVRYQIRSRGIDQRQLVAVTWTWRPSPSPPLPPRGSLQARTRPRQGRWLVIGDTNTLLR